MKKQNLIPPQIIHKLSLIAKLIAQEVPFQLWDECIEYLTDALSVYADDKSPCPNSVFFVAEVKSKLEKKQQNARYIAIVQEI